MRVNRKYLAAVALLAVLVVVLVLAVNMLWNQTYREASYEEAYCVVGTVDGGFAIAGYTDSFGAGGDDFWLVKTDSAGNVQWDETYGGASDDIACSLVQTGDGGYAIAGYTDSFGAGSDDFWLVKTDSAGNMQWSKTYGGSDYDQAMSLVQTGDGGFAIAGYTDSFGAGSDDFWLVKTDSAGNVQWDETYGRASYDEAYSLVQTGDGGYALAGETWSFGADNADFWLVKTDASGHMQWNRTYGGADLDIAYFVVQTVDGGFAIAGWTRSFGAGGDDFWLVKADQAGNMQWSKTYGGADNDQAMSLVQTGDGGYAIAGYTDSFGAGGDDFWLVKTDSAGNVQWDETYGGASYDEAYCVVGTVDGGYALAGETWSFGAGNADFWLVKIDSNGNVQWSQTYGGASAEEAFMLPVYVQAGPKDQTLETKSRSRTSLQDCDL